MRTASLRPRSTMTSTRTYGRFVRRVALLFAAALIAIPVAQAAFSGGSGGRCVDLGPSVVCQTAVAQPAFAPSAAGPGPGVGPVIDATSAMPSGSGGSVIGLNAGSFDWKDAGIGAALGFGAALLGISVLVAARRRGRLARV